MRTFISSFVLAALLGFATTVSAIQIPWQPCEGYENVADQCTVHHVDLEPCSWDPSHRYCRLLIGTPLTFSFDFTPNFSGTNLQHSILWKHWYQYLPMEKSWTDNNPCNSTICPVTAGSRQTYRRTFMSGLNTHPLKYLLESKIWTEENKYCCFTFEVELCRAWNFP